MPAVKRDWERRMREIRTSGVTRGRGGAGRSFLLYRLNYGSAELTEQAGYGLAIWDQAAQGTAAQASEVVEEGVEHGHEEQSQERAEGEPPHDHEGQGLV